MNPTTRRAWPAIAAVAVLATGCGTPSPIADDAEVRISGRVVTTAGRPVPGAEVTVRAHGAPSDLIFALPGLNYACVGGQCATLSEKVPADDDGSVVVTTTGRKTKTPVGNARNVVFEASPPGATPPGALGRGGSMHFFMVLTETVNLPPLVLWNPTVTVTPRGARLLVGYEPLPGQRATYHWSVQDLQGNTLANVELPADRTVDARLIEDFPGRMTVSASYDTDGVRTLIRSAVFPVTGRLAPPSRGAACSRRDLAGRVVVSRPCGLTDGNLNTRGPKQLADCDADVARPAVSDCVDRTGFVDVDLGTPRPVSMVTVRGVTFDVRVETSVDGRTWRRFGKDTDEIGAPQGTDVITNAPVPARFVRLHTADAATEAAIW